MKKLLLLLLITLSIQAESILIPKSFQANFKQIVTNPKNKIIKYSGKVHFSEHSKLKWEYLKPTKKEVCTNENELVVVDHDLEQVSKYNISKGFNLNSILAKAKQYSGNIYLTSYNGKKYTIKTDNQHKLQSIAFYDDLDNKVQILFINVIYKNKKLSSKKLTCTYPKDYDVIKD